MMKKFSTVFFATLAISATNPTLADSFPNLVNKTFYSATDYNAFRDSHLSEYQLPSTKDVQIEFPIKFGTYELIYLKNEPSMNTKAPFFGNKLIATISAKTGWLGRDTDLTIIINRNIQTTSNDWHFGGDDIAECENPALRQSACTFKRLS